MNIEFDCAVPPTASPSPGEGQAHTLPMFSMSPVTNVFPKKSLFPFPFTFPLQLAMCHSREKQHRQQHRACDKSLQKQSSPEMPVSSAISRQKQQGRQALRNFYSTFEFALGTADFSWAHRDCSLPYQQQDSSF